MIWLVKKSKKNVNTFTRLLKIRQYAQSIVKILSKTVFF